MAGERQLPGLGLYGFWTLGSNGYRQQHSSNLRTISAMTQLRVVSRTTALPARAIGNDETVYIVPSGAGSNPDEIAIADFATDDTTRIWVYIQPAEGFIAYVLDDGEYVTYDGSDWGALLPEPEAETPTTIAEKTGAYSLVAGDFNGKTVIEMNLSSAAAVTVPSGLTVTEPIYVVQTGAEAFTVTASGTTLNNKDGLVSNGQWSFVSILPRAADTFLVSGDLTV